MAFTQLEGTKFNSIEIFSEWDKILQAMWKVLSPFSLILVLITKTA